MKAFASSTFLMVCLAVCFLTAPVAADELRILFNPESIGPFPAGLGGQVAYSVSVEIADVESDGFDSQGVHGVGWHLFTDTGAARPVSEPALTGETGWLGPAIVTDARYDHRGGGFDPFVGGYGYRPTQLGSGFRGNGYGDGDDLLDIFGTLPLTWTADVDPDYPGLQPLALAGVGIGERPVGGAWLLAQGLFSYPAAPGEYTIDLVPIFGTFIVPGLDLTQDHAGGVIGAFEPEQVLGDSFSFVVVPEPGAGLFLIAALPSSSASALRRRA